MKLNPEQQSAVDHIDGPCVVTAVPGSGKTRTLTSRVINLIQKEGINPKSILCLTFTNKAANEMKERIADAIGVDVAGQVWISTFHRLCLSIIRRDCDLVGLDKSFSIYNDKDQKSLLDKVARMHEVVGLKQRDIAYLAKVVNDYREGMESESYLYDNLIDKDGGHSRVPVAKEYMELLDEFNAVDFSGILYKAWQLVSQHSKVAKFLQSRFQYVMIDEGQDTNKIQYEIVKFIADHGNLFVVGDYQQSIFSWRGACPENLHAIKTDFEGAREIVLPRNYRSTASILDAAERLIRNNPDAEHVSLQSELGDGHDVFCNTYNNPDREADKIAAYISDLHDDGHPWKDFAILYRLNSQSQILEIAFRKCGMPYRIYGGFSFFDRSEVKTTLAYLKFLANPSDTVSFARAITEPARSVGKVTVGRLERICQQQKISMLDACAHIDEVKATATARASILQFAKVVQQYRDDTSPDLGQKVRKYLTDIGYYDHILKESEKDASSKRRIDNVDELINGVTRFSLENQGATVTDYLHTVELITTDDTQETDDAISLLTIHSAKGLEFPIVFVVGCEEDMIPHKMSIAEKGHIKGAEEERRLMYVAVTRAQSRLYLSHCRYRGFSRSSEPKRTEPSRFLAEMSV